MSRARRATVLVAVLLAMASVAPAGAAERPSGAFEDDDGIPAEPALEWLADAGIIDGCNPPDNSEVCPDRLLTRAEAAKILVLLGRHEGLLGSARPGSVDHFADDDTTWGGAAAPLIGHLADLGIVHGCDPPANTRFCPEAPLLRGQVAKLAVGVLDLEAPAGYVSPWGDTDGRFYHETARVAAYHGLWDSSEGAFRGHEQVSRAEFAQVVVAATEPGLCAHDPFTAARRAELARKHPGVSVGAYAYDFASGCAYWLHPDGRLQTGSVFKVMVMAGALLESQRAGRPPTEWEMSQLEPMITESANPPVRALWGAYGGSPWFREQARAFGLGDTIVVGDDGRPWGRTRTSALDQADLLRQVLLGEWGPLGAESRAVAVGLMKSITPAQTWGVTAGVPDGRDVAQKNGFAAGTANSVGVVYGPDGHPDYVVVILTNDWPHWTDGVALVEEMSRWVAQALAD